MIQVSELFSVTLDRERYSPGDAIEGTIEFHQLEHKTVRKAREVRVKVFATVDGSGDRESVVAFDEPVHRGSIDDASMRFRATLNVAGPVSYDGCHVKVRWGCLVSLDVPFAIDPCDLSAFEVVPRGAQ